MSKKKNRKLIIQFVEYMVSGGVYFWSGYIVFALLYGVHTDQYSFDGLGWSLWWATITSSVFGWTLNYILQRFWVFNNKSLKGNQTQVTTRYIIITLVDFVLNYYILYGLKQLGISPYIGQFISSGFFTIWNYLWYRFWVFPEKLTKKKAHITPVRIAAHRAHGQSGYRKLHHA